MNTTYKMVPVLFCIGISACAKSPNLDGNWWHSVSQTQRLGFLAGSIDYLLFDGANMKYQHVSWEELEPLVGSYYASHPDQLSCPVLKILSQIVPDMHSQGVSSGEKSRGKHGIFDGEYWRQAELTHRIGFVQGYLEAARVSNDKTMNINTSVERVVGEVSNWFGVKQDDPGEINEKRSNQKIAYVIRKFSK